MKKYKLSYCKIPFEKIGIFANGDVRCSSWLPKVIGNIFEEHDFNKIWNSRAAQAIRSSMINETYEFCWREYCPYLLKGVFKLLKKKRTYDNNSTTNAQETVLSNGPVIMSINYDPTCNLYCKSCRNRVVTLSKEKTKSLLKFQENLIKSSLFKDLRELDVAGNGEPFASKVYLTLLKSINKNSFPNLRIILITNGILLTPTNWEKISNSHYAISFVKVSIDAATKETYNKLRRGGNFDKLLNNLKFLSELKKNKELELQAVFVMQKGNYKEMPAFVELMKNYNIDSIFFSRIVNYGTFNEDEFRHVAVHRKGHPEHNAFLEILRNPVLKEPGVSIAAGK